MTIRVVVDVLIGLRRYVVGHLGESEQEDAVLR